MNRIPELEKLYEGVDQARIDKEHQHLMNQQYRLVSDYGFGDKSWLERGSSAQDIIDALNRNLGGHVVDTIEQALDYTHPIYSIEIDNPEDEEDWDWMDS